MKYFWYFITEPPVVHLGVSSDLPGNIEWWKIQVFLTWDQNINSLLRSSSFSMVQAGASTFRYFAIPVSAWGRQRWSHRTLNNLLPKVPRFLLTCLLLKDLRTVRRWRRYSTRISGLFSDFLSQLLLEIPEGPSETSSLGRLRDKPRTPDDRDYIRKLLGKPSK